MSVFKNETEFKEYARSRRWRLKRDEDGSMIAKTRSRRYAHDHLYYHGPGALGVAIRRNTKQQYTWTIKELELLGCEVHQRGEMEANLLLRKEEFVNRVAKKMKVIKGNQPGNISNLVRKT